MRSPLDWIRYQLERWVLRGSLALILLLVALLSAIATLGGVIAYFLPGHHFTSIPSALWWATLRISDPGYLSDDIPDWPTRALSMCLSVMGMVVTVGGVVAIVTQVMNRALRALAAATTPVPFTDHVVVIGVSDRTEKLLRILLSDQLEKIVVLLPEVTLEASHLVQRISRRRGHRNRVVLRSGKSQRAEELARTGCGRARSVIFPATARAVAGDPEAGPRLLMSLTALKMVIAEESPSDPPAVVVELVDRSLRATVRSIFPEARILASDRVVARTLKLSLQGKGLAAFAFDAAIPRFGHALSVADSQGLHGVALGEIDAHTTGARVLGVLTQATPPQLELDWNTPVRRTTQLLTFGRDRPCFSKDAHFEVIPREQAQAAARRIDLAPSLQRILVLGWNEVAPDFVFELLSEPDGRYEVDFLSMVSQEEREREIHEVDPEERLPVRHFEAEPMTVGEIDDIDLRSYSRFLVLADRSVPPETADERTLAVTLSLERRSQDFREDSTIALELLSEDNLRLSQEHEGVVTPLLSANLLSTLAGSKHAQALSLALSHQATYVPRVVIVPRDLARDDALLSAALRSAGYALLHVLPESPRSPHHQVVICETASRASTATVK